MRWVFSEKETRAPHPELTFAANFEPLSVESQQQ